MRRILFAISASALLSSCTSTDGVLRSEGVTSFAGNAIAANTAMQMVDPWPRGVQNTSLKVPAERSSASDTTSEAAATTTSSTTP